MGIGKWETTHHHGRNNLRAIITREKKPKPKPNKKSNTFQNMTRVLPRSRKGKGTEPHSIPVKTGQCENNCVVRLKMKQM
jgi:hypothetical protein